MDVKNKDSKYEIPMLMLLNEEKIKGYKFLYEILFNEKLLKLENMPEPIKDYTDYKMWKIGTIKISNSIDCDNIEENIKFTETFVKNYMTKIK